MKFLQGLGALDPDSSISGITHRGESFPRVQTRSGSLIARVIPLHFGAQCVGYQARNVTLAMYYQNGTSLSYRTLLIRKLDALRLEGEKLVKMVQRRLTMIG